jgi:hypothetical protein
MKKLILLGWFFLVFDRGYYDSMAFQFGPFPNQETCQSIAQSFKDKAIPDLVSACWETKNRNEY